VHCDRCRFGPHKEKPVNTQAVGTHAPNRSLIAVGAILGMLAVVGGTFAAHVLPGYLDDKAMDTFEVAVRYHMYHALGIFAAAWVGTRFPGRASALAGWLFVAGIVLFSGSLYVLVSTGAKWLGMVAPIGGSAMIVGWLMLALAVILPTPKPKA
jgi:uncharacterized membrane protein YgdD (TMEM256/DUF423 family)